MCALFLPGPNASLPGNGGAGFAVTFPGRVPSSFLSDSSPGTPSASSPEPDRSCPAPYGPQRRVSADAPRRLFEAPLRPVTGPRSAPPRGEERVRRTWCNDRGAYGLPKAGYGCGLAVAFDRGAAAAVSRRSCGAHCDRRRSAR